MPLALADSLLSRCAARRARVDVGERTLDKARTCRSGRVASVKVVYDAERVVLALQLGVGLGSFTSFDSVEAVLAVDGLVASTARWP
jgi:hypothetical protein